MGIFGEWRKPPNQAEKKRQALDAGDSVMHLPESHSIPDHQGPETLRELLRITVRDVARDHGIPPEWLGCEVLAISKQGKTSFQVKVVINQWDEQLLLFARAFELAYAARLRRVSPAAGAALRAMVWSIAEGAACPYDKLPEKEFWSESARHERETLQKYRDVDRLLALSKNSAHSTAEQATVPMELDPARPKIAGQILLG